MSPIYLSLNTKVIPLTIFSLSLKGEVSQLDIKLVTCESDDAKFIELGARLCFLISFESCDILLFCLEVSSV
jgi:hypothetical protein